MLSFPEVLKNACVIPLPKTGNLSKVTNWRPVSQLNIFSKLIEKAVHNQLMAYLLEHQLICDRQFGFMPGRSTHDAIFGLVQDLYEARNSGDIVAVVFLDLRKAFDTVNHLLLLSKLKNIGCNNESLSWFTDYLSNRSQRTLANGVYSSDESVTCGVPPGFCIGAPALHHLYK